MQMAILGCWDGIMFIGFCLVCVGKSVERLAGFMRVSLGKGYA
jgi:hypothetical protein